VTRRDIERLARHFNLRYADAEARFTKPDSKGKFRMMRHRKDRVFDSACMMLDQEKRRCTIYDARPGVCRKYPDTSRCGYYEFLKFERAQQGDEELVALT
jgi:Fe-S-cluster containining protein